jgi:L-ascorbate metabolism protein UlaG (beta-lactamase superfamily)
VKITSVTGKVIIIDPFLTNNPKTPQQYKNLDALGKIDLLLVTHAHGDHLGDAPDLAKKHNAPMFGPAGLNRCC